ncbi:MAG: DUF2298 domain-containing protein, partial [Chloroflexota bacterium]|nr:DUF2298 domain-containing protein [Chloroflexota bacterium]
PDISTTEQPMDLMFLSSTVASPYYPPMDAWFAGEPVSYYYLGYLLIGSVALLTNTVTPVAYSLGLATYAAMAAVAAFGLTFNLVRLSRASALAGTLAGGVSVFLLLVASNVLGILELGWTSNAGTPGLWAWITPNPEWYTDPQAAASWRQDEYWWWWRASRVVPNGITEFPAFSFLLGDMHPHVMSIGFVLLIVGVAVQLYLRPGLTQRDVLRRHFPLVFVTALSVGGAGAINLWDLPLGLTLIVGAVFLNAARNERRVQFGRALAFTERFLIIGAGGGPRAEEDLNTAWLYAKQGNRWRLEHRIEARGLGTDADFGASVAAHGDMVAVGAPRAFMGGLVQVYTFENERWTHAATLKPDDDEGVVGFGQSVAIYDNTVVVASLEAVYVYRGEEGDWSLVGRLYPSSQDGLPTQVALEDGLLACGVLSFDGWLVDVFKNTSGEWTHSSAIHPSFTDLNRFGRSLSLDAGRLAVGGDAVVTIFSEADRGWVPIATLGCPVPSARDSFGSAVALQDYYLAVGAPGGNGPAPNAGCAFVFQETSRGWRFQTALTAEDTSIDTALGSAVAIRGDDVVLGAPGGGQGGVYSFHRTLETWTLETKIGGRRRFGRALASAALLVAGSLGAALPFLYTFESSAEGVLPVEGVMTRPAHLVLAWGVLGILTVPFFIVSMRHVFRHGNWSLLRFSIPMLLAFSPVLVWMQPVFGIPIAFVAVTLFAFHQMGFKQPHADEALFAFNPRVTLVAGSIAIIGGILWYSIFVSGERGTGGELLAIDRLVPVVPFAIMAGFALFGAWTLAHRDSENMRQSVNRERATQWNSVVPGLFVFAIAAMLVMGAELFHVVDIWAGGPFRRMNTVFKLYYQAWLLLAVLGGFSVWFITVRWNLNRTMGRMGSLAWRGTLVVLFIAAAYYPAAAADSRIRDEQDDRFTLDGTAYLTRYSPADYDTIQWVRTNTPRDAVVLEGSLVPCSENQGGCSDWKPELARIASATGRPTILGWEGHERQWRSGENANFEERQGDVRLIYQTQEPETAARLLSKHKVDYVVVGPRERAIYGDAGIPKFSVLGSAAFVADGITVYRIDAEGAA